MQRMKLHLSGVKLPKLGSLQDRVYREYLTKESQLEAEKTKLLMLNTLTNPTITDHAVSREWTAKVKEVWSTYLSLQFYVELPEHTEKETHMLDYYQQVVKKLKPTIERTETGYNVKGLDILGK